MFGIGPTSQFSQINRPPVRNENTGVAGPYRGGGFLDPNRFNPRTRPLIGPSIPGDSGFKINPMPRMGNPTGPNGETIYTTMPIGDRMQMPIGPGMQQPFNMPQLPDNMAMGSSGSQDNGGMNFADILRRMYNGR